MGKISVQELRVQQKGWTTTPIILEWPKYLIRLLELQSNDNLKSKVFHNADLFKKYEKSQITLKQLINDLSYVENTKDNSNKVFNYICDQLLDLAKEGKFNG